MGYRQTTKLSQRRIECSVLGPLVEEVPGRGPGAKLPWKIPPRRTRSQDPEDGVENLAAVSRTPASLEVARREQV